MSDKSSFGKGARVYSLTKKGEILAWSLLTLDERIEARIARYKRLEAEEQVEILGMQIKEFAEVDDVYDIGEASVTCMKGKPSYTYSPSLTEIAKDLKEKQKVEVQTGIAEVSYGEPFLQVNFRK